MVGSNPEFAQLAEETLNRCRLIAGFTETAGSITRTFLSHPMRDCHLAVSRWMEQIGMFVSVDPVGNVRGLHGRGESRPRLLLGSHLDTVPVAGAYDGVLGVSIALAIVEAVKNGPLPFDIEILGFSEEEGVRFRVPFLGSLAAVGRFDPKLFDLQDASGCSLADAIRAFGLNPAQMHLARIDQKAFAYLEFHIEQGPMLDRAGESIAAVSAIAGQSRLEMTFRGQANHAGTTPMELRCDALAGAAEWINQVERHARSAQGLVATVGKVEVLPGAGNVIPGEVRASLDVRHWQDETRIAAARMLCASAEKIASRRGLQFSFEERMSQNAVLMDPDLVSKIERAMRRIGEVPRRMVSGAGHDAMIMAGKVPSAMVFLRSIGGISHHPDEAVRLEDVQKAIRVGVAVVTELATEMRAA